MLRPPIFSSKIYQSLFVLEFADRRTNALAAAASVGGVIRASCASRNEARVIFACAPSQNEFLDELVRQEIAWNCVTVFHMDEYVGLEAVHPQSFRRYLDEHLLSRIQHTPRAVHLIQPDNESECERYAALLAEKPIDLVCLGIGENGHIAFNDPHVADFDDPKLVKIVELDAACRQQQVNDGCFPSLDEVPSQAITLTIPALMGARHISCVVPGERKARAVRETLLGPITTACPASILRTHSRAVLHIDQAAASLLAQ